MFSGHSKWSFAVGFALVLASPLLMRCAPNEPYKRIAGGVEVKTPTGVVRAEFCSEQSARIVAGTAIDSYKSTVPAVLAHCGGVQFKASVVNRMVTIQTEKLRIEINPANGTVRFLSASGETLTGEAPGSTSSSTERVFQLADGEALYGLGQHQEGFLNLRDIPIRLLQANTNIAIPFLVSTHGYGLLWNNAALTDFNPADQEISLDSNNAGSFTSGPEGEYGFQLSGNGREKLILNVDENPVINMRNMWLPTTAGGKIHLAAHTTYRIAAETGGGTHLAVRFPSSTMRFRSQTGEAVDYYFLYGPKPEAVVASYRYLTGAAPMLPRWAYGFWQCRERYASQQQILDTAAEFRQRKIPVDVFVQDWQYWGKYGWNAMRFDENFYPDPAVMMKMLHAENLHLMLSVWAKFGSETELHQAFQKSNSLLHSAAATGEPGESKERESWVDLFNPQVQKDYWEAIRTRLFNLGIDGWWLDASEPEGDPLDKDTTFLGAGRTVRNAYPLFETSAVFAGQKAADPDRRVVILSRSAYTGQQRNASISWSGDISGNWETLRRQIPAGLNFSSAGMPYWTTDTGGFFRPRDQYTSPEYRELLIRWFEFGAFNPVFRIHGYQSETEMWKYGTEAERILRQYDELRYRMMPYIYSTAWGVTSRGEGVMKALPMVYPQDTAVRESTDSFLFGNALLIAPVVQKGAVSRNVVLPATDDWIDFWSGKKLQGGRSVVAEAPLDRLPMYARAGSIVPMGPVLQSTADVEDPIELRIYGGRDADFVLYEDSGDGYAYEHGERAIVSMHWNDKQRELLLSARNGSFAGMRAKRTFNVVLVSEGRGTGVGICAKPDQTVVYEGHPMKVHLRRTEQ